MRIVLVFQCGIANVFKVDRFSAIPETRGNVVRLYQGDFRSAEMMATGTDTLAHASGRPIANGRATWRARSGTAAPATCSRGTGYGSIERPGPRATDNPRAIRGFRRLRPPGGPLAALGRGAGRRPALGRGPADGPRRPAGPRRSPRARSPRAPAPVPAELGAETAAGGGAGSRAIEPPAGGARGDRVAFSHRIRQRPRIGSRVECSDNEQP